MVRATLSALAALFVFGAILFGAYGGFDWPMAWAVLAWWALYSLAGLVLLPRDLIAERSRMPEDAERMDLVRAGLTVVVLFPVMFIVCGLDARFGWSPALPPALRALGFAVFVLGYGLALVAARVNRFFSAVVSIQRTRGHHLVDRGPYAVVRHPGYAGPLLGHVGLSLALGSLWGLLPAVAGSALLMWRAVHEERRLARELAGYAEYMQRVRYRIVPHVW